MLADFLTAEEAVDVVAQVKPALPVGSLKIKGIDNNKEASLYFKDGLVYAAKVENHAFPILSRVESLGLLEEDELSYISRDFTSKCDPRIPAHLLGNQLVSIEEVRRILVENFFAVATEILSWNSVEASWNENDFTEEFTIEFISVAKLISECKTRRKQKFELLTSMRTTDEFFTAILKRGESSYKELSHQEQSIASCAEKQITADDIAATLGMTRQEILVHVKKLVDKNIVVLDADIVMPSAEPLIPLKGDLPKENFVSESKKITKEEAVVLVKRYNTDVSKTISHLYSEEMSALAKNITMLEDSIILQDQKVTEQQKKLEQMRYLVLDDESEIKEQEQAVRIMQRNVNSDRNALEDSYKRFIFLNELLG